MPDGEPTSPGNIVYAVRYTERDDPKARGVATDVRVIRNMVGGGEG